MARITHHLGDAARGYFWGERAGRIKERILQAAWSDRRRTFAAAFGSEDLDAGVLLMGEVGFLPKDDPRWVSTVEVIGRDLRHGQHLYRYDSADDFGLPQTAFTACTFWYVDALARIGRRDEARELFCNLLATRNPAGLLSEDVDVKTGQLWGNFPQTYSMVGIINGAMRLSQPWSSVL
jgi:GH15 family glucan-1,4-alpha-glucosidase